MARFIINKGIGKPAEFRGLKSQYLYFFAGGLVGVFVLFIVLYMAGVDQTVCIVIGVAAGLGVVWGTFVLNARFGEYGLMKRLAVRSHPNFISNRVPVRKLLKQL